MAWYSSLFSQPNTGAIASPWTPNTMKTIVLGDIFGDLSIFPVTRADAMQVAPVVKARALITGTIASLPLKAYKDGVPLENQPNWLFRTSSEVSPQVRLLWTIDDLMFTGYSLWAVDRGSAGQILDAVRVPIESWSFNSEGQVEVHGNTVPAADVILFQSSQEGLLDIAGPVIRSYQDLTKTRASRLRNPIASIVLHPTEAMDLEPEEIEEILDQYESNHRSSSMPISWMPHNINVEEHGATSVDLFAEQANQLGLAIAGYLNVDPTLIGAAVEASGGLTYQNAQGARSWFIDQNLKYWLNPILWRLSMDDCVPRGITVDADLANVVETPQPTTGPKLED